MKFFRSKKEDICNRHDITPLKYELLKVISKHKDIPLSDLAKALKKTIYIDPLIVAIENAEKNNRSLDQYINDMEISVMEKLSNFTNGTTH